MILPFALFITSVAACVDIFHPFSWMTGMYNGMPHLLSFLMVSTPSWLIRELISNDAGDGSKNVTNIHSLK